MSDPYSDTLTGLWTLLMADSEFASYVKPGNKVRFDNPNDRQPLKSQLQAGDLPEVILMPAAGQITLGATSSSHRISKNWSLQITTGDQRWTHLLAPLQYRMTVIFGNALDALPGCPWVKKLRLMTEEDILGKLSMQDGPRGWRLVAGITTEIWLAKPLA